MVSGRSVQPRRGCRVLITCLFAGFILGASGLRLATTSEKEQTARIGTQNFRMTCPVTGVVGQVMFNWRYSPARHMTPGRQITTSGHYMLRSDALILTQVTKSDAGIYVATVTDNTRQTVKCTISLVVQFPPEITENPPNQVTGNISEPLVLTCPVRAVPAPVVAWMKNGRTMGPSPMHNFNGTQLIFVSISQADRGQYQCTASNNLGVVTSPVTLVTVQVPLRFVMRPQPVNDLREYDNFTASCNVTGYPHARILWYKDDVQLRNSSHHVMYNRYTERSSWSMIIFNSVNVSDNGLYKCEATNVYQRVEYPFELVVHAPPRITSYHPPTRTVHVGDEVNFLCTATGFPPPKFTWFLDGKAIPRVGNTHFIEGWDGKLAIYGAVAEDAGNYTCYAANDAGQDWSTTVQLIVVGIYFIEKPPAVLAVQTGNSTSITCEVSGADFGVQVEWFKNGARIRSQCTPEQANMSANCFYSTTNNTLYLNRIRQQDIGVYTCRATELQVRDPEVIEAQTSVVFGRPVRIYPRMKNTIEGDLNKALTMECKATGSPPPTVEWLYRGLHLTNDSHRTVSGGLIKFRKLLNRDSGHYLCLASNGITEDRKDIRLHVNSVPSIMNLNITLDRGRLLVMQWNVVGDGGYPVTSFKYEFRMLSPRKTGWGGRHKIPPNKRIYTLKGLKPNATYEIKFWASNKLGDGEPILQTFTAPSSITEGGGWFGLDLSNESMMIYIGAGVGALLLLIVVIILIMICKKKSSGAAYANKREGVEDGHALVDNIQESPSHVNPAYGGADNANTETLELADVKPTDSNGTADKPSSNGNPGDAKDSGP